MGGGFPKGQEYNLQKDAPATIAAVEKWPRPIVFSGFEIGEPIQTGAGLKSTPATNPVRRAYELYNGLNNRSSWDQTAVLYAVRGLDGHLGDVWDVHTGGSIARGAGRQQRLARPARPGPGLPDPQAPVRQSGRDPGKAHGSAAGAPGRRRMRLWPSAAGGC